MRVQPGSIDAEMAGRAMRRIKDYLMRHPDQAAIPVTGEQGGEEALILPREAVSLHPNGYCGIGGTGVTCPVGLTTGEV
jgi:hypothetical protein